MLLLIRAVNPQQFGFFAAFYGVLSLPQTLLDFGLPTLVIHRRAKARDDGVVTSALRLNNRFSFGLMGILLVATSSAAIFVDQRYWLLIPLSVWAAAERNADAWLGVVFADGDVKVNTANLVSRRAGNLLIFFILDFLTDISPLLGFSISSAVAAVSSWTFAHLYVAQRLPAARSVRARQLMGEAWPYWLASVATQARNVDTALTSALAGPLQAGFYAAASRLTGPLRILPVSLAYVLFPAAAKRSSSTMTDIVKILIAAVLGIGVISVILVIAVPFAVPLVLGTAYAGAIVPIQVMCGALTFASAAALLGSVLQGIGLKHFVAQVAVITTATCIGGVAIGALTAGSIGAACGLAFSYVLQTALEAIRFALFISRREPNR